GAEPRDQFLLDPFGPQRLERVSLPADLPGRRAAGGALTVEDVPPEALVLADVVGRDEEDGGDTVFLEGRQGQRVIEVAVIEGDQGVLAVGVKPVRKVMRPDEVVAVL